MNQANLEEALATSSGASKTTNSSRGKPSPRVHKYTTYYSPRNPVKHEKPWGAPNRSPGPKRPSSPVVKKRAHPYPPIRQLSVSLPSRPTSACEVKSARRRGNRSVPSLEMRERLQLAKVPRIAWSPHPTPRGVNSARYTLPRKTKISRLGPRLALTARKGVRRYSQTSHSNTPETVRLMKPPTPVRGTYLRLFPYSNHDRAPRIRSHRKIQKVSNRPTIRKTIQGADT
uniref:Uncharacterized protein n=1 Tax=Amorphochlora amoebiformis TaxID=1561963 RepID=A0A7S0DJN4_9EUKA|mmetsp:Transcript_27637/g.43873  ORF Transcript_27637/g.43873 Transcript_27637/m.43873 type:complete len:229 (+) Transcript_27637:466-1152(+)